MNLVAYESYADGNMLQKRSNRRETPAHLDWNFSLAVVVVVAVVVGIA